MFTVEQGYCLTRDGVHAILPHDFDEKQFPWVILSVCDVKATSEQEVYVYLNSVWSYTLS